MQNEGMQNSNQHSNSVERYHIEQSAYQLADTDNEKDHSRSGTTLPLDGMGAGIGGLNMMNLMKFKDKKDPKPEGILKKSGANSKKESPKFVKNK